MTRLELIKHKLNENGLDGVLVTSTENHRYSCGFNNPDGQVLITKNKSYVFADFRYTEAAKREAYKGFEVIMPEKGFGEALKKCLSKNDVKTLGFEEDDVTFSQYVKLTELTGNVVLTPAEKIFSALRITKTESEVDCIIKAQRIAEKAYTELLKRINYNMTELDVAAELEYLMKKNGAEAISFETIAVSGSNSSSPHGVPGPVKLEKGFLTLDFGAVTNGYHSDMTRTVVIGKADEDMKKVYNTVLKAQTAVLDIISEGKSNFEMDETARNIIHNAGYGGLFGHSLGHGVGLQIHELPNLSPRSPKEQTLHAGEIVTVEPGIYIEGKYGCRIEDMVLITKGGALNLTESPKDLIEL